MIGVNGRYKLLNKYMRSTIIRNTINHSHSSAGGKPFKVISYQYDFLPRSVKRKVLQDFVKKKSVEESKLIVEKEVPNENSETRVNGVNMQMLSKNLYNQIFQPYSDVSEKSSDMVKHYLQELSRHGVNTQDVKFIPDVEMKLPPLEGKNLEEHFQIIGEKQCGIYRNLTNELINAIPEPPKTWLMTSGWTRYAPNSEPEPVDYPLEDALVFDVEVAVKVGPAPTLATAVSDTAWYGWVSLSLIEAVSKPPENQHFTLDDFIPVESNSTQKCYNFGPEFKKPKIIVGHNVSFDRSKIKEQYWFEKTGTRLLDTMSLHVCVSGITSYQRAILKSGKEDDEDDNWKMCSSLNSLSEVHKLYCGYEIDKQTRDIFLEATLPEIKDNFQTVMSYCAGDVVATHSVLQKLFPLFLERFPHPVTLSGMLELGLAYLPVNNNWNRYINDCEQTYEDLNTEAKVLLARHADNVCQLMHDEKYKEDLWMWDQDWSTHDIKLKKTLPKKVKKVKVENENIKNTDAKKESNENKKTLRKLQKHAKINCSESEDILNTDTKKESDGNKNKFRKIKREAKINCNKDILNTDSKNESNENKNTRRKLEKDCKEYVDDDEVEPDPLEEKFASLMDTYHLLPARRPHMPGYPLWYRKLCSKTTSHDEWVPGPFLISTSMQVTPKLLCLTWEGFPLHYIRDKGWGFLIPHSEDSDNKRIPLKQLLEKCPLLTVKPKEGDISIVEGNLHSEVERNLSEREYWRSKKKTDKTQGLYKGTGIWCNVDLDNCCWFMKLPHKNGASHNVGNPLARDFLNKFSDNVLAGASESAEKVLSIARMLSYWRNNRDRIMRQVVVWLKNNEIPKALRKDDDHFGAIIPHIVVCGTLTRRAMEPTWMTASNAQKERVGSELRSMVQAPPGYSIVGADVDSQELWIASVLGDAHHAKIHGVTPLGWMTLNGTKSDGTDMHSVTAKAVGISRDHAKIINYARIYGAGQLFAERLLKQFNPSMSEAEARSKASKMFAITKGKREFRLKQEYTFDFIDKPYSGWQAFQLAKLHGKKIEEVFEKPRWIGGSESSMFNRLEEIAGEDTPVTPFLHGRLSRALEPKNMPDDRFLPTRVNWVVQSGAVDFLHLMLVCMRWLLGDEVRFCLSFHDEIRYLVPSHLKYDAALAMHITNLLTRSFCSIKLGIHDLPQSVAFFSSVEVDTVLRKESNLDCRTPSNPHGLEKGYNIPHGESLSIQDCIEKTGGVINLWKRKSR